MFYIDDMRIACIHIPRFYVQVERLKRPGLKGRPVVVGGRPDERALVIDCSEEAEGRGVRPALTVKEAYHLCPGAIFVCPDKEEADGAWEEAISMLQSFSMRIEALEMGTACLDITKTLNIYGSERSLAACMVREIKAACCLEARAGVGNSMFVARSAAFLARPHVHIVPSGREKEFLAPLSVEELPVDGEIKERLALLGLDRLEKVAALSIDALIAQFGRPGKVIHEISRGAEEVRPISRREGGTCLEKEVVCEAPIEATGYLRATLDEAFEEITTEMAKGRRSCRVLRLVLHLMNNKAIERQWIMHVPTSSKEEMVRRIMDGLMAMSLESPIRGFTVYVRGLTRREPVNDTLFAEKSREREGLRGVKDYLRAKYGSLPLVKVEETDPHSRLPERRFVFVEA